MTNIIYLFISLIIGLPIQLNAVGKDNLLAYYNHITKAENFIINDQTDSALVYYDLAFKEKESPFAVDLNNAAILAIKNNNNALAISYCIELGGKGVGVSFFEKSVFSDLRYLKEWQKVLNTANERTKAIDLKYGPVVNVIKKLIERDQEFSKERAKRSGEIDIEIKFANLKDSISKEIMKIFDVYGYLSEDIIGVDVYNDTSISHFPLFNVLILHNYQGLLGGDTTFQAKLRNAVYNGDIKPELFAYYNDWSQIPEIPFGGKMYRIYKNNLYCSIHKSTWLQTISDNRKSIMLYDLKDYENRIKYLINNNSSYFMIFGFCGKTKSFYKKDSEDYFFSTNVIVE